MEFRAVTVENPLPPELFSILAHFSNNAQKQSRTNGTYSFN
jgi:hypothetical protein